MNPIIKLRTEDFSIEQGSRGAVLATHIKGLSLAMFWSPGCPICVQLEPRYRTLPQMFKNIKFLMLNINENKNIIELSRQTIAPIEFVPYIVFYVNGRPFLQYDDELNFDKLVNFVRYSVKLVETKKTFVDKGAKIESDIPKYTIAKPYAEFKCNDEGFCYLTYSDAYGKKAN
jgi:thiol-disulfide isomerase/thioredoxin